MWIKNSRDKGEVNSLIKMEEQRGETCLSTMEAGGKMDE